MINFNEISAISKTWNYRKTEDRNGTEDSFTMPEYSEKLKLKKVGGKSVVWNQNINLIDRTYTSHGITMISNNDGSIILNGTADTNMSDSNCGLSFPMIGGHKYFFTGYNGYENSGVAISDTKSYSTVQNDRIYTASSSADSVKLNVYITSGSTFENVTLYPKCINLTKMFGSGNEPTTTTDSRIVAIKEYLSTHQEYNEGQIIDSLVDKIEVQGVNLLDEDNADDILNANGWIKENEVYKGWAYYLHQYSNDNPLFSSLHYEENKQYTLSLHFKQSVTTAFYMVFKYTDGTTSEKHIVSNESDFSITSLENKTIRGLWLSYGNTTNWELSNIQISKGTTNYDYKPYSAPKIITTNFPSLKSAGSVYDYIDFTSAVKLPNGNYNVNVIRNVGQVDLGSLDWYYFNKDIHPSLFKTSFFANIMPVQGGLLNCKYTQTRVTSWVDIANKTMIHMTDAVFTIKDDDFLNDLNGFKNSLNGQILYYELATPTTETITVSAELLEWLKVEYGGNMYYKQDTLSLPIPNTTSIHKHIEKTEELSQIVIDDEVVWSAPVSMFSLYDDDIIIDEETPTDEETPIDEDEVIEDGE